MGGGTSKDCKLISCCSRGIFEAYTYIILFTSSMRKYIRLLNKILPACNYVNYMSYIELSQVQLLRPVLTIPLCKKNTKLISFGISHRKSKGFVSQILTKECRIRKVFDCLMWIENLAFENFEGSHVREFLGCCKLK